MCSELLQDVLSQGGVGQQRALGDLDGQHPGGHVPASQQAGEQRRQIRFLNIERRKIDRDGDVEASIQPCAGLTHRRTHHPAGERSDQAGLFGQRDEAIGPDQPELGVLPAQQRLYPNQLARAAFDFWLVVQHQLLVLDRSPQRSDERQPRGDFLLLIGGVDRI